MSILNNLSGAAFRQAANIKEKIETLQNELVKVLNGATISLSVSASEPGTEGKKKRGMSAAGVGDGRQVPVRPDQEQQVGLFGPGAGLDARPLHPDPRAVRVAVADGQPGQVVAEQDLTAGVRSDHPVAVQLRREPVDPALDVGRQQDRGQRVEVVFLGQQEDSRDPFQAPAAGVPSNMSAPLDCAGRPCTGIGITTNDAKLPLRIPREAGYDGEVFEVGPA